jgi:hypothetical protein
MAPTLSLFKQPKLHSHRNVPPTSPFIQMPNVFVVPPEEDHSPSWCYFDAADAPPLKSVLSTPPDIDFLDDALGALNCESPAVFHRYASTSSSHPIMPLKSAEPRPRKDVLMNLEPNYTDNELDLHLGLELESEAVASIGGMEGHRATEDSLVLEVIKLRRHHEEHVTMPSTKHSRSFRSRASRAFRSFKNVSKGSIRSKSYSPRHADDLTPRERTPAVSRRSSIILSQLFTSPVDLTSSTSASSFETQRRQEDNFIATPDQRIPVFVSSMLYDYNPTTAIPKHLDSLSLPSSCQDSMRQISRSPSPTSIRTLSNKRRFSLMSLQRLFSFSESDSEPPGSGSTTPTSMSISGNFSRLSTASLRGPDTPTEGVHSLPTHLAPHIHLQGDRKDSLMHSDHQFKAGSSPALGSGDSSFEMRLDSLHFENLSFDPSRF